jgi:hypothetical protein
VLKNIIAGGLIRYNPVLGEFFRCTYTYEDGSEGFFIAEQVSHHPVSDLSSVISTSGEA